MDEDGEFKDQAKPKVGGLFGLLGLRKGTAKAKPKAEPAKAGGLFGLLSAAKAKAKAKAEPARPTSEEESE